MKLNVRLHCDECEKDMELYGFLTLNAETKTQSQEYKCPGCRHIVAVTISPEDTPT